MPRYNDFIVAHLAGAPSGCTLRTKHVLDWHNMAVSTPLASWGWSLTNRLAVLKVLKVFVNECERVSDAEHPNCAYQDLQRLRPFVWETGLAALQSVAIEPP
jgi:hypothetical protein